MIKRLVGVAALGLLSVPASAAITVTPELPGVLNSTLAPFHSGVETFDGIATGTNPFSTNFGGSSYTGDYSNAQVLPSDAFGGAGNAGNYVVALNAGTSFTLQLDKPANYFGFWLSALHPGNVISFHSGADTQSFDFNFFNNLLSGDNYFGKPGTGATGHEQFAFFNFQFSGGQTFDSITFSQVGNSGGFESDNHTVGMVPEPGTWAMMIAGFGLVGFAARRRRTMAIA